jgi:hypothetical protein
VARRISLSWSLGALGFGAALVRCATPGSSETEPPGAGGTAQGAEAGDVVSPDGAAGEGAAVDAADANSDRRVGDGSSCDAGAVTKHVFVTLDVAAANDLASADGLCSAAASDAGLKGSYAAWLSWPGMKAIDRVLDVTYVNAGTNAVVFGSKADVAMSNLCTPIGTVGGGAFAHDGNIWTGTRRDGTAASHTCQGWATTDAGATGVVGLTGYTDYQWTEGAELGCDQSAAIICFEE